MYILYSISFVDRGVFVAVKYVCLVSVCSCRVSWRMLCWCQLVSVCGSVFVFVCWCCLRLAKVSNVSSLLCLVAVTCYLCYVCEVCEGMWCV